MADHVFGIDDLDVVVDFDVGGRNHALALLREGQSGFVEVVQAQGDVLEVEQDFDHVFLQTFERRVFVQHAVDFDFDDRGARDGRQ